MNPLGAVRFIGGVIAFVLAMQSGGQLYAWIVLL